MDAKEATVTAETRAVPDVGDGESASKEVEGKLELEIEGTEARVGRAANAAGRSAASSEK